MPKIRNLQPKIIFSSRIECRPVPSWNMTISTLKSGSKVMGLGQWGKKIKIVVWCLVWQQIKSVDSLNHLKLFKNHECLTKWYYLRKGSILGSDKSNVSRKIHVRDVEGPYGHPPQNSPKSVFPADFFHALSEKNMLPEVNHRWQGQDSQCQDGCHENMPKNEK